MSKLIYARYFNTLTGCQICYTRVYIVYGVKDPNNRFETRILCEKCVKTELWDTITIYMEINNPPPFTYEIYDEEIVREYAIVGYVPQQSQFITIRDMFTLTKL